MNRQAEADIRRKTKVLEYAKQSGNVSHTCRKYGVSRDSFYRWKKQLESGGPDALVNSKPCPENPTIRVPKNVEEKILYVKDRKFYRVVEARRTENGHCILVTGPKERVSRGPGFVGARFGT